MPLSAIDNYDLCNTYIRIIDVLYLESVMLKCLI